MSRLGLLIGLCVAACWADEIDRYLGQLESPNIEVRQDALYSLLDIEHPTYKVLSRVMEKMARPSQLNFNVGASSKNPQLFFNESALRYLLKNGKANPALVRFLFNYTADLDVEIRRLRKEARTNSRTELTSAATEHYRGIVREISSILTAQIFDKNIRKHFKDKSRSRRDQALVFASAVGVFDSEVDKALAGELTESRVKQDALPESIPLRYAQAGPATTEAIIELLNSSALKQAGVRSELRARSREDQGDRVGTALALLDPVNSQLRELAILAARHTSDARLTVAIEQVQASIPATRLDDVLSYLRNGKRYPSEQALRIQRTEERMNELLRMPVQQNAAPWSAYKEGNRLELLMAGLENIPEPDQRRLLEKAKSENGMLFRSIVDYLDLDGLRLSEGEGAQRMREFDICQIPPDWEGPPPPFLPRSQSVSTDHTPADLDTPELFEVEARTSRLRLWCDAALRALRLKK